MSFYYDKNGEPLELMEWARLMDDKEYCIVAQDRVGKYLVSTVWVGIGGMFAPDIFETIIFYIPYNEDDNWVTIMGPVKYASEKEAKAGHAKYLQEVTDGKHIVSSTERMEN